MTVNSDDNLAGLSATGAVTMPDYRATLRNGFIASVVSLCAAFVIAGCDRHLTEPEIGEPETSAVAVPAAPSHVIATRTRNNTGTPVLKVTFQDNSSDETGFRVERAAWGGSSWTDWTLLSPSQISATVTYKVRVLACNSFGCSSSPEVVSEPGSVAPIDPSIPTPTNFRVESVAQTEVVLTWNAAGSGLFIVERRAGGGPWTTWEENGRAYDPMLRHVDRWVSGGVAYEYRVSLCSTACSLPSAVVAVTPPTPAAPTDLIASRTETNVTVTWTDNASDETRYEVLRRVHYDINNPLTAQWGEWQLATLPANATQFTFASGAAFTYQVLVRACNAFCSAYAGVTALPLPATTPGNFTLTALTHNRVAFTWEATTAHAAFYKVERRIEYAPDAWTEWDERGKITTTRYDVTDVSSGLTYQYRISACNYLGCSAPLYSPELLIPENTTFPALPSNLSVSRTATHVILTWTDNATNETRYEIGISWYNEDYDLWQSGSFRLAANSTQFSYLSHPSTAYRFWVQACNDYCSERVHITADPPSPTTPANFTLVTLNSGRVHFTWEQTSPYASTYKVERRVNYGPGLFTDWYVRDVLNSTAYQYNVTDVSSGFTYEYRISACNVTGCSVPLYSPPIAVP
jgi:hypothetical protein